MNVDEAFSRLQAVRGKWKQISDDTGLDYSWLTKFGQRKIKNPGARKIERLASHPLIRDQAA